MILKKLISVMSVFAIIVSSFTTAVVSADEEMTPIACTQSASYLTDGDGNVTQTIVNYAGKEDISNINWNTKSNSWGGVGVLEFTVPAAEAKRIKSATLTVSVHNGSSRSGGRTYDIYPADITINADTTASEIKAISLDKSMYQAEGVKQGETRTDQISTETIREYVKGKVKADVESKVQFAFSNSSQTLDIDPKTATLALTMYDGGVALDKNELILSTSGEPQRLTYPIFGEGINDGDLVWISENEDIATVDDTGLVTPKKAGRTVVSIKTADSSFKANCAVTVLQAAQDITIDKASLSLLSGGKNGELTAKLLPETAVKRQIKWTSSDENVATVSSNGIVTPISVGETIITAAAADNEKLTASCNVTVAEMAEPQSISLDKENVSLPKLGATTVVNANIQPSNADDRITWTSSDEKIAKVYDGVIVAGEVGTAEITATTSNGKTAKCTVTVTEDKQLITNDRFYTDTDGNILYSQGGGIFKFPNDDKYYWYGVRYKEAVTYATDPLLGKTVEHPAFEAYTCYTSDDLVNWKYEGDVATLETLGQSWCGWAGRCGVVYNEKANKYVLVSQFNGTIIASADNPKGPFKTEKGYFWGGTSLPVIANGDTGDLTMFYDEDSKGYMICSSANGRGHLYIAPMDETKNFCDFDFDNIKELNGSTGSYFDEDGTIKQKDKGGIEGDCMFKYKDHYYFTGSDLYGWRGSRVYVFESKDILGDYKLKPDYIDTSKSSSNLPYIMPGAKYSYAHNSQTGFYYTLHGSKQDTVIYCGDRWCDFGTHGIGYNQWVPLTMDGYTPHFNDLSQWKLNSETGEWTIGDGNNYIANNEFDADRVDVKSLTGWECSDSTDGSVNGNVKARRFYGNYAAKQSADTDYTARIKQTIKDLPNGIYTLRASVMSSGGQNECVLYANTNNKNYTASLKSKMSNWTDVVVKDIIIENGECEIGLYSDSPANCYVRIDDMYLTRNYDGTVIEGRLNTNVPDEHIEDSITLKDMQGNAVNKLNGAEVYAEAVYTNDNADRKELTLYMALYDNYGKLKSVKQRKETIAAYSTSTIKTDSLSADTDSYIKLFLWEDGMKPLYNSITIKEAK